MDSGEGTEPARCRAIAVSRPAHKECTVGSHSVISSSGNTSGMPPTRVLTTLEIDLKKKSHKFCKFKSLFVFKYRFSSRSLHVTTLVGLQDWSDIIQFVFRFKSPNYSFDISLVDIENIVLCIVTVHTQTVKEYVNFTCYVFISLAYMTRVFSHSAVIKGTATNLQPTAGSFHNSHAECLSQRCVEENMTLHKNSTNILMLQSPQKTHPRGIKIKTDYSCMFEECLSTNTP